MKRKSLLFAALLILALFPLLAFAQSTEVYFSLSSSQTFRPDQKPRINVYAHNVDVLEFRVYKVEDAEAFFSKLEDLHELGVKHFSPREQVDQRTLLEKFHDWKLRLWHRIRDFFRGQFSGTSRAQIRDWHSGNAKRSSVNGAVGFASVPLLNSQQLVARWRMEMPPKYVSESANLPIDNLKPGLYAVEATDGKYRAYTIVVVSQMLLVTKTAPGQVVAFTVDRKTGAAIPGAKITVWGKKDRLASFTTGPDGSGEAAVHVPSTHSPSRDGDEEGAPDTDAGDSGFSSNFILALHGDDVAIVAPYSLNLSSNPYRDWAGYVYTDRPVYRPGHTVQFKAILRKRSGEQLVLPTERQVQLTITDANQNPILKKTCTLSPFGSINGSLELPATAALGYYTISASINGSHINGNFEVQEYKKPEYFVKVTPARLRVLQGDTVQATIEARYYFGEPVANANVTYVVHTERAWLWGDDEDAEQSDDSGDNTDNFYGEQVLEEQGKLDANGRLVVSIPTSMNDNHRFDINYRIEARVTDAANREVAGHNAVLATYGSLRLSSSTSSYLYHVGDTIPVVVQALDYDKHPHTAALKVQLLHHNGSYGSSSSTLYTGTAQTGSDGYARFNVPATGQGSATLRVTTTTPEGREVEATDWFYIVAPGDHSWADEDSEANQRQLQIVADKPTYKVGDIAHIVIMGGVPNATIFVTAEGHTVTSRRLIQSQGENASVDFPITTQSQPNFTVGAFLVNDDHFYTGNKSLKVPPVERTLKIDVAPSKPQFQPGESATYNVQVHDAAGHPVRAELSLGVVDDAIYAVRPESSGNIVSAFYSNRYGEVQTDQSFTFFFQGQAGTRNLHLAGLHKPATHRALAQVKASDFVQPKIRKAFPDTTFWAPEIHTDDAGRATVHLAFPDSLTTWRATVRAITADTRAGAAVNKVLVRKNLMVRIAAPRFFRQGDEITISTIVHNYLDSAKLVRMSLDVTGLDLISGATQQLNVPQRAEAAINWRLRTRPGQSTATLLAKALTNEESDAMEISLPIVPFGVKQSVAASGSIVDSTARNSAALNFPSGIDATSRGLDLELTPSIAGAIFDGLEYLTSFPYGCTEQTMSSFLPNVVVASTLRELKVPSNIDPARLKRQVDAGFDRLYGFQHPDGGWGWWKDDDSMVFMTAYVISGMAQAQSAGFEVKPAAFQNGQRYLRKALADHPRMIPDLRAFVVYSLALTGERDRASLDKLWEDHSNLSAEGIALAGLAMRLNADPRADAAGQALRSLVRQEGDSAFWQSSKDDLLEIYVDNSAEATAYAVRFLTQLSPSDPLLPKAVLWMMRHRNEGYWYSTKQTAMVLLGVTDYLKLSHELDAAFTADIYVNGKPVLTRRFTSQDATSGALATLHLPASAVADANTIQVRKNGTGRLYWSARGTYYSTAPSLYNQNGLKLSIFRDYFKLTSGKFNDKIVYDVAPLNGPVQTGDLLAIRVTVTGDHWKYLMVEDPIPAGTEFVEHDDLYELRQKPGWWSYWYSRREFHDDRAVLFQTWFDKGHEYFYLVKVTNAGNFRISPATVQPMYQPNVLSTTTPAAMEVK